MEGQTFKRIGSRAKKNAGREFGRNHGKPHNDQKPLKRIIGHVKFAVMKTSKNIADLIFTRKDRYLV